MVLFMYNGVNNWKHDKETIMTKPKSFVGNTEQIRTMEINVAVEITLII